jgi:hypothetical protein
LSRGEFRPLSTRRFSVEKKGLPLWMSKCVVSASAINKAGSPMADKPKHENGWHAHAAAAMKIRNRTTRLKTAQAPHSDRALIEAFIRERGITKVPMGASGPPSGSAEVIEEL